MQTMSSPGRAPGLAAAVALLALAAGPAAYAQSYPVKPVRLVHGFLAGGNVDLNARLIAAPMSASFGQQVIVDGRPGAGGTVAAAQVARSPADGYTLFLAAGGHAVSPSLYRSLPYDAVKDFTFITLVTNNPYFIATHPSFPARTVADLVRLARKDPGKLDYATGGVGTGMHLVSLLFQSRLSIKMLHVPYRGGSVTPTAVAAGEVPFMFGSPGEVTPLAEAGKLRLIAVTSGERWKLTPQVPTLSETVLPGFDVRGYSALIGPAGLPPAIVARVNETVREALGRPEVIENFRRKGSEVAPRTPEETQRFVAGEVARWAAVIKAEGIPLQN
ncbi:MAG: tripartite tricarboxylate transporter substrate binding protein [Burkholderiales bacterium]|nr:tripartite tricarboxylate transporter substrate binding protein [Burkholderiales bacterium]